MYQLGYRLMDPSGKNIWEGEDPLGKDPEILKKMSKFFTKVAVTTPSGAAEPDTSELVVGTPVAKEEIEYFSCRVDIESRVTIPGGEGVTLRVKVKDPQIEPGGLYALELDPILAERDDLQIAPAVVQAKEAGQVTLVMDLENPSFQRLRLPQRRLGQLIRVDKLPSDHLEDYLEPKSALHIWKLQGQQMESDMAVPTCNPPPTVDAEARKLMITDMKEHETLICKLVNWDQSNAMPEQCEQFLTEVLIPFSHVFSLDEHEISEAEGVEFKIDTTEGPPVHQRPC